MPELGANQWSALGAFLVARGANSTVTCYSESDLPKLRQRGKAGRNEWHYFTYVELKQLIPKGYFETNFAAHGILSFGDFGGGIFQKIADFLDKNYVERFIPLDRRVVFSLTCAEKENPDTLA